MLYGFQFHAWGRQKSTNMYLNYSQEMGFSVTKDDNLILESICISHWIFSFSFSRCLREYYCTTKKPQHYTQLFRAYVKDTIEGMISDNTKLSNKNQLTKTIT